MLPRTLFYLHRLRRNLHLKPSDLKGLQWKIFRAMVKHAYDSVPFYHRKFRAVGVKPEDVKDFDDVRKIPLVTKHEIQSCNFKDVISNKVDLRSLNRKTTSGSTGVPLTIFTDDRVEDFYSAVWMRAMLEVGVKAMDRIAVISDPRHFPIKKTLLQRLGILERKYISIFDNSWTQMAQLKEFRPDVIRSYASSLFILTRELGKEMREVGARIIISGAEILDPGSRKQVTSAFGAELFDFYACSEFGLLAWECKEHGCYHINSDSVFMEFLDENDEEVAFGEKGRIVCTSLFNDVMPLIRYVLDDVATMVNDRCACGTSMQCISNIEGRSDSFLTATNGRLIPPTVFFPYPFESVEWIKQFRVIQENIKKLVIQVVVKEPSAFKDREIMTAKRKINEVFGADMEVKFEFLNEIPRDSCGKFRKVISYTNKPHRNNKKESACLHVGDTSFL